MIGRVFGILGFVCVLFLMSCAAQKPGGVAQKTSAGNDSDMPVAPKDAQYTIYCQAITGADHLERSRALRQLLRENTPLKDWYVVHGTDQSTLYYGFYRSVDPRDPANADEGARAMRDLKSIRTMVDTRGIRLFSASLPVLIDAPDPSANPAWDLTRSGAYWSLEIAVYRDSPDRKQAAVDAVREARAQGIEAYYYHGETASSVCIGAWPKQAVREIDTTEQNNDPDAPLYVTSEPLSPEVAKGIEARGLKPVAPQVELLDPTLTDTMRRFPEHAINGEVPTRRVTDPKTGQVIMQPESSYLVKGPFVSPNQDETMPMTAGAGPTPSVREMPSDTEPGVGKLKSLGD
jgi:hypothetical protein